MSRSKQESLKISATDFKAEDRVQVIDREATPEENKSRIFYNHMRGLTGTVRRVYEEENEVFVDVDIDSLHEDVRARHLEIEDQMRRKWLDSISDEARRKLRDQEKQFKLRYSIMVTPNHLILLDQARFPAPGAAVTVGMEDTPRRKSLEDLSSAEQEFLDRARTGVQPR